MKKLSADEISSLKNSLKVERDSRINDRIKVILWHDEGINAQQIAALLYVDDGTIYRQLKAYREENRIKLHHKGSKPSITAEETAELIVHLTDNCYVKCKDIQAHIHIKYDKLLSLTCITRWLNLNKFSYKKPKIQPKADPIKQAEFIKKYQELEKKAAENFEPVIFIDSVHPSQQTRPSYGWIRTGQDKIIEVNSGRKRLNIMGGIDLENMSFSHMEFDTIDSKATILFLKSLEEKYKDRKIINIILDNAGYYKSEEVSLYLTTSRVKAHFLPPRSPNLNSIERLWKVMHEYVSNNKVYAKFSDFKAAVLYFFDNTMPTINDVLINRVTDSFRVFDSA